jgi:hypothetical protein
MAKTDDFIALALAYDGNDCLLWPYAKDNHGRAKICRGNRCIRVHRLICTVAHGEPKVKEEATHSCGNGHLGCVAKRHLRWQTHAANMAEMVLHGRSTRGQFAKLTPDRVIQIRALRGVLSQSKIAEIFNVGSTIIGSIHRREKWAWL